MDETVIAIKLVSGLELLCCMSEYRVDFGIKKYRGKIPRKVFHIESQKGKKVQTSHQLFVTRCIEMKWFAGQGIHFSPLFHSSPSFDGVLPGISLSIHSNDVIALNCVIAEHMSIVYRQTVGLIKQEQMAIINHNETHQ